MKNILEIQKNDLLASSHNRHSFSVLRSRREIDKYLIFVISKTNNILKHCFDGLL